VDAGMILIAQPHPHLMPKQSRINDEDDSTSDDIEMFFD